MEQNCIRDIVMIIIYRPLSRSRFFPRVVKTFGPQIELSHILLAHFLPVLNKYLTWKSTLEKTDKKKPHKAQGQQHSLSTTQINKGLDKEQ